MYILENIETNTATSELYRLYTSNKIVEQAIEYYIIVSLVVI